jgi:hypothetical protein
LKRSPGERPYTGIRLPVPTIAERPLIDLAYGGLGAGAVGTRRARTTTGAAARTAIGARGLVYRKLAHGAGAGRTIGADRASNRPGAFRGALLNAAARTGWGGRSGGAAECAESQRSGEDGRAKERPEQTVGSHRVDPSAGVSVQKPIPIAGAPRPPLGGYCQIIRSPQRAATDLAKA